MLEIRTCCNLTVTKRTSYSRKKLKLFRLILRVFETMSQFSSIMKDSKGNPSCKSFFISMMTVLLKWAWIKKTKPCLVVQKNQAWIPMGIISPNLSLDLRVIIYMLVFTKPSLQRQLSLFIQTYIAVATLPMVPLIVFNRKITYSFKSQSICMFEVVI